MLVSQGLESGRGGEGERGRVAKSPLFPMPSEALKAFLYKYLVHSSDFQIPDSCFLLPSWEGRKLSIGNIIQRTKRLEAL